MPSLHLCYFYENSKSFPDRTAAGVTALSSLFSHPCPSSYSRAVATPIPTPFWIPVLRDKSSVLLLPIPMECPSAHSRSSTYNSNKGDHMPRRETHDEFAKLNISEFSVLNWGDGPTVYFPTRRERDQGTKRTWLKALRSQECWETKHSFHVSHLTSDKMSFLLARD